MWPYILAYVLILVVWSIMSFIAIQHVYTYAYNTDRLSRNLTLIYILISIALAINGMRVLLSIQL